MQSDDTGEKYLNQSGHRDDDWFDRAMRAIAQGQFSQAATILDVLLRANPDDFQLNKFYGSVQLELGERALAVTALRRALRARRDDCNVWGRLGAAYMELGRFWQSSVCLKRAVALKPTARYYVYLAQAYTGMFKFLKARRASLKALELDHDYGEAWLKLAIAYRSQRRHAKALRCFKRAFRSARSVSFAMLYEASLTYAALGQQRMALRCLATSVTRDKESCGTYVFALAVAQQFRDCKLEAWANARLLKYSFSDREIAFYRSMSQYAFDQT